MVPRIAIIHVILKDFMFSSYGDPFCDVINLLTDVNIDRVVTVLNGNNVDKEMTVISSSGSPPPLCLSAPTPTDSAILRGFR